MEGTPEPTKSDPIAIQQDEDAPPCPCCEPEFQQRRQASILAMERSLKRMREDSKERPR